MANRTFQTELLHIPKRIVKLWAVVSMTDATTPVLQKRTFRAQGVVGTSPSSTLGAAPTSGIGYAYGNGTGVRSVARTGTGLWTFTLSDPYQYLLGVQLIQTANTTGLLTTGFGVGVDTDLLAITTNTAVGNGGVFGIVLSDAAGNAADPATGDVLTFEITLGDATEP